MRRYSPIAILILALLFLGGCGSSGGTTVITVLGYTVVIKTAPPPTALAGASVPVAFTITENESDGTSKPASGKSFTVTVTGGGGTINGSAVATLTTAADGSVSFTWILGPAAGTQTVRGSIATGEHLDVSVVATAPPATQMTFTSTPSASGQSGVVLVAQPAVQLKDASGNPVAQAGVAITASIDVGGGILAGNLTATTDAGGLATFSGLMISGLAGTRTLKFTATLNGVAVNLSATVAVTAGPASQLSITTTPSTTAQSGLALTQQPTVQLLDAAGNPVTQALVPITVAIDVGGGTLGGTLTVNTNASGAAVFSGLAVSGTIGNRILKFTATLGGVSATVSSASIGLTAGIATQLALTTAPSASALSGVAWAQQPTVQIRDAAGNPVAQALVPITVTIDAGGGALNGTTIVNSNASGAAAFTGLFVTGIAGPRTLKFAATLGGLPVSVSVAFAILPGVASQLTITTQPGLAATGMPLSPGPAVQLRDPSGGLVPQAGIVVTASVAVGTMTLGGILTATTDANGLATFANLVLTGPEGTVSLRLSAVLPGTGLTSVVTNPVDVFLPGNGKIAFVSGKQEIWVINPTGTNLTQLTPGYGTSLCLESDKQPVWSPDGSKIAFVRTQNELMEIWTMNADGSNQTRLTFTASAGTGCPGGGGLSRKYNQLPSWSPDGSRIIYASDQSAVADDQDLWIMNANGTGQAKLFGSAANMESGPVFSRDGQTIVFGLGVISANGTGCRGGTDGTEIWLLNSDGTNPRRHTTITGCSVDTDFSWTLDGLKIYFAHNQTNQPCDVELWSVSSDPLNPNRTQYTNCSFGNASDNGRVSPDGTLVLYRAVSGGGTLRTMQLNGSSMVTVSSGGKIATMPSWQAIVLAPNLRRP